MSHQMLLFLSPTGANRVQSDYCEKHAAHIQALAPVRCLARSRAVISNEIYIWGDFSVNKMTLRLQENVLFLRAGSGVSRQRLFPTRVTRFSEKKKSHSNVGEWIHGIKKVNDECSLRADGVKKWVLIVMLDVQRHRELEDCQLQ